MNICDGCQGPFQIIIAEEDEATVMETLAAATGLSMHANTTIKGASK